MAKLNFHCLLDYLSIPPYLVGFENKGLRPLRLDTHAECRTGFVRNRDSTGATTRVHAVFPPVLAYSRQEASLQRHGEELYDSVKLYFEMVDHYGLCPA